MRSSVRLLRTTALVVAAAAVGALLAVAVLRDRSDRTPPQGSASGTSSQPPTVTTAPPAAPSGTPPSTSATQGTTSSWSGSSEPFLTERRSVPPLDGIVLASAATVIVHITPLQPAAVTVTGEKTVVPRLLTQVRDGLLTISADGSYDSRSRLIVDVTAPSLTSVELRGSGQITVSGLDGATFRALLSGSGSVTLDGRVDDLNLRIGGSGNIQAGNVRARTVRTEISGSGDIDVTASDALDARIPGAGVVTYAGSPRLTKIITGAGSVRQR